MIYLDHAATTPTDPRVLEAMLPYLTYEFGNPGSIHCYGHAAKDAIDRAREQTACFFHCLNEQIIFTSGGSEGNNMVFCGISDELRRRGKPAIVISGIEHDSVWKAAHRMKIKHGFDLRICPPNKDGQIELSAIEGLLDDSVGLVSVMAANNETGVLNDVLGIGKLCQERGILFHTDAVQLAAVEAPDTESAFRYADFITVSGHKFGAPKGVGALYARNPSLLAPLIVGGAEQEFGLRGGTENVPGIVGLGMACEIMLREQDKHAEYLHAQRSQMIFMMKNLAQQTGVEMVLNSDPSLSVPKTINVRFPGIDAQTLLLLLDSSGICVSAGSACRAHENIPSRVLTAMGLSEEDARSSIRISISHINSPDEIDGAASAIIHAVQSLKEIE